MKNLALGMSFLVLLLAASCSSHSNNSTVTNGWTYFTESYHVASSVRSGSTVTFTSNISQGTLALNFYNGIPATSGPYTVVNGNPTAANQVSIAMSPGVVTFLSTGLHHESVAVTVAGTGKITATIPSTQVAVSPFYSDSTNISGTVSEL